MSEDGMKYQEAWHCLGSPALCLYPVIQFPIISAKK